MFSFVVTLCLAMGVVLGDGPLSLSATMKDFKTDGVTLEVICNYSVPAESIPHGGLVALTISRTDWSSATYTEVATINTFNSEQVVRHDGFQGEATGYIGTSGRAAALKLSYHSMSLAKIGGFRCESTCLTDVGKCVHNQTTVNITPKSLGIPEMDSLIQDLRQCQQSINSSRQVKKSDIVAMTGAKIHWVRNDNTSGHFYALANKPQVCSAIGGYVVEINTKEEFLFLQSTLLQADYALPSGKCCFATGASYTDLSEPFTFAKNPGDEMYFSWANDEPDRDEMKRNQLIVRLENNKTLTMLDGLYASHDTEFLCEIDLGV